MQPPHGAYMLANTIGNGIPQVMSMTPSWWGAASFYSGPMSIHPSFEDQTFPTRHTFVEHDLVVEAITPEWIAEHILPILPVYAGPWRVAPPFNADLILPTRGKLVNGDIEVLGYNMHSTTTEETTGYTLSISSPITRS